jgi:hypothetical protein
MCLRGLQVIDLASFGLTSCPVELGTVPTGQQVIIEIQFAADPISVEISGSANYLHCIRQFVLV